MKLSIKRKISLLIILTLVISIGTLATVSIYYMKQKTATDLADFRREETEKVEQSVESYVGLAYQSVEASYKNIENKDYIEKVYGHRLKNIIDIAEATLIRRAEQVKRGELKLAEAQQLAIREIEAMRYDQGTGYIWINDTQLPYPAMIMHPTVPATNGKVLNDPKYNCASGTKQNFFQLMVQKCMEHGSGFVGYMWPKPGSQHDEPKLSFVKRFAPLGWIIGTGGVYRQHRSHDGSKGSRNRSTDQ